MTAKQELYELGLADEKLPLRFASYGEPGFDEVVDDISSPAHQPEGATIVRVTREVGGHTWEKVAVLVMSRTPEGEFAPRRVGSYCELRSLILAPDTPVPGAAIAECQAWLDDALGREVRSYETRQAMLQRHRDIGDSNKAFLYLLAIGMLRAAKNRPDVIDPERINQVFAEAREMAEEDRPIILDMQLPLLPDRQRRDLMVHLGAELHAGQWRSTPHFRKAAMHVIAREVAIVKKNHKGEATTTRLLAQLGRKAEELLV